MKQGRNEKCNCGSGKKFKSCCLSKLEERKKEEEAKYDNGHNDSSDKLTICAEYFREEYSDHKTIDISNYLTSDNYRNFQIRNYNKNVIMVAEKNDSNKTVFASRGPDTNDIIIMYRGSYRTCRMDEFDKYVESIDEMIQKRLAGEEDK